MRATALVDQDDLLPALLFRLLRHVRGVRPLLWLVYLPDMLKQARVVMLVDQPAFLFRLRRHVRGARPLLWLVHLPDMLKQAHVVMLVDQDDLPRNGFAATRSTPKANLLLL